MLYMGNSGMNQDFKPIFKPKFKRLTLRLRSKQQLHLGVHGKIEVSISGKIDLRNVLMSFSPSISASAYKSDEVSDKNTQMSCLSVHFFRSTGRRFMREHSTEHR